MSSSTVGETWRTKSTWAPCGDQTRSWASATPRDIEVRIISRNCVSIWPGSGMMSTVPSSAWEIRRISSTCQSVPAPRQSHWK